MRIAPVLVLAAGVALCARAFAEEPVTLIELPSGSIPLAGHLAELHDPDGKWTLDDVRQPERAAQFTTLPAGKVNHGLSDRVSWYRMALQSPPDAVNTAWVLSVGLGTLDYLDIHVTRPDGTTETTLVGDLRPPLPQVMGSAAFAIPVPVPPGETVTIHLRVQQVGRHQVLPDVWSVANHVKFARRDTALAAATYAILLVMAVYNLLIFAVIRDRAYAWYVLFLLSMVGSTAVFHGEARVLLGFAFPAALPIINAMASVLGMLVAAPMALFAQEFMQTRRYAPRLHRLASALVALNGAALIAAPVLGFLATVRLGSLLFLATMLGVLGIASYLAVRGVRSARFFVFAWTLMIVAQVMYILSVLGVVAPNIVVLWSPGLGICVAVTLLSLALADRLNGERRERERFARLKQYLPQQVAEVVTGGNVAVLEPKRRNVTVLVMDLRGFTPFSETSAPEDVMAVLREFYETMGAIVEKHGGTVEHFAGDSMLVFFNAPLELAQPESHGIECALAMRATFEPMRQKWLKNGHELGLGIGIANGYATTGAIGFSGRSQYAAIGAVTNLASRLCSSAVHGEILTTGRVLAAVEGQFDSESAGEQTIRGFSRPVQVARVIGPRRAPARDLVPAPQTK